jgi:putative copper resistance protein D
VTLALILARWVHLSASILLASLFLFEEVILLPTLAKSSAGPGPLFNTIHRLTHRTAWWTLLVVLLSWFVWSWLIASTMTGGDLLECLPSGDWLTVVTGTLFGQIWIFRMIIGLLIGIILLLPAWTLERSSFLRTTLAGLSIIELVSLAWAGHASASPGSFGIVHLLGDALHLLASAFWPGALLPLSAFLVLLLNASPLETIEWAAPIVRRFSASSLTAVAALALTGLSNAIFMVGSIGAILTTTYGQILLSKLILFVSMIGFGAWNLFLLKPRIAVNLSTVDLVPQKKIVRLLLRNVLWEIALGTVILLIVALLGITPPPLR